MILLRTIFAILAFLHICQATGFSAVAVDGGVLHCDQAPVSFDAFVPPVAGAVNASFGDSFTVGAAATIAEKSFVGLVTAATGWPLQRQAIGGKQIQDIVTQRIYPTVVTAGSHFTTLTGINDLRFYGKDAAALGTYQRTLQAGLTWLAIPNSRKVFANSAAVTYSGNWTPVSLYQGAVQGRYSGTDGDTATVQLEGTAIYVGYMSRATFGRGGIFTVAVDGVVRATVDTSAGVNSGSPMQDFWPEVVRIGGLVPGLHTVAVKVKISADGTYVNLDWFGSNGGLDDVRLPLVLAGNTPRFSATGYLSALTPEYNNGSDTAVALYNVAHHEVAATLRGDGLGVFPVDVAAAYDPNVAANVSADHVHPTDAGHAVIAGAFLKAFSESVRKGAPESLPAKIGTITQGTFGTVTAQNGRLTYTPGVHYTGRDTFSYQVTFPTGGLPPETVSVSVRGTGVITRVVAVKGVGVAAFKSREVGSFLGSTRVGSAVLPAIFETDGQIQVKPGDAAPGLAQTHLIQVGAPSGQAAMAKLKIDPAQGVTSENDSVLLGGLAGGSLRIAAREGQVFANETGFKVGNFLGFDGNGSVIFFLASLKGQRGKAMCAALADGSVRLLAREGDGTIVSIGTLVGLGPTLADGRWRVDDETFGVRVSLSVGRQILYLVPATAGSIADWKEVATLGGGVGNGTVSLWGFPGFGPGGAAARVTLSRPGIGGDLALVHWNEGGPMVLASRSQPVPGADDLKFTTFYDPVTGGDRKVAFFGMLGDKSMGLWFSTDLTGPRLIARTGDSAPGGGRWAVFKALTLPDGVANGPLFTGTLSANKSDGITAKNRFGLWGVDSGGTVRLLLRTGDQVEGKTVISFDAASAAAGSLGSAHGTSNQGLVSVLATFDDRSVALLEIGVP